jgi:hypothetical protein
MGLRSAAPRPARPDRIRESRSSSTRVPRARTQSPSGPSGTAPDWTQKPGGAVDSGRGHTPGSDPSHAERGYGFPSKIGRTMREKLAFFTGFGESRGRPRVF